MNHPQYLALCAIGLVGVLAYWRAEQVANLIAGRAAPYGKPQTLTA